MRIQMAVIIGLVGGMAALVPPAFAVPITYTMTTATRVQVAGASTQEQVDLTLSMTSDTDTVVPYLNGNNVGWINTGTATVTVVKFLPTATISNTILNFTNSQNALNDTFTAAVIVENNVLHGPLIGFTFVNLTGPNPFTEPNIVLGSDRILEMVNIHNPTYDLKTAVHIPDNVDFATEIGVPLVGGGTFAVVGRSLDTDFTATLGATLVPEPGSLALVASALAGFGLLSFRRRRRVDA